MNHTESDGFLTNACQRGLLEPVLEEYLAFCHEPLLCEASAEEKKERGKGSTRIERFPNLAGFCRYLGCSTEEWLAMEREHPATFGRLRAVLEDEALNAAMSPTVIAAYLKKRLGYEKDAPETESSVSVRFEHDVWRDGE